MKRIIVIALLLLIALLFLYCAHLDGIVHIKAFAADNCEFCEFLEEHDLEADKEHFPLVISQHPNSYMEYDLELYAKCRYKAKGAWRSSSFVLKFDIPMSYCPECGRRLEGDGNDSN